MADQGSQGLLSGFLRNQRIRAALPCLRGRVLDFGCGSGALAAHVDSGHYAGVDIDESIVAVARLRYPRHIFHAGSALPAGTFDTIVSLAVIEHVEDPAGFLDRAARHLAAGGTVVLTTPHPDYKAIHDVGARLGLFSRAASEQHERLLDGRAMRGLAFDCGLTIVAYRRFLFGANQLFVLARNRLAVHPKRAGRISNDPGLRR